MGALVWLASYPKSGNTWTRHFLHSLIRSPDQPQDINAMVRLTVADSTNNWYRDQLQKPVEDCSDEEIAAVRPAAVKNIAAGADGLVFVKTHNAMVKHLGTPMIEPSVTAGAVYIVRNPLDVAVSYAHFFGTTIDRAIERMNHEGTVAAKTEGQVYQYYGSWREHVHSWTRREVRQLHVMRYEDMLDKPFETFGRLAEFLRIAPTRERLEAAIAASSFDRLKEQEEATGFAEKPETSERFFRAGRAGQWRDRLTPEQVKAIVEPNREQMARFGYLSQ